MFFIALPDAEKAVSFLFCSTIAIEKMRRESPSSAHDICEIDAKVLLSCSQS